MTNMNKQLKRPTFPVKVVNIVNEEPSATIKLDAPDICRRWWDDSIAKMGVFDSAKEHMIVILLNTRYYPIGWNLVSIGSLNEAICHPREMLRPAVASGAYAMIMMHNHPSGDPSPSQADQSLTRRIAEGAELLQIKLLDHIIVGKRTDTLLTGYFSFKEAGLL